MYKIYGKMESFIFPSWIVQVRGALAAALLLFLLYFLSTPLRRLSSWAGALTVWSKTVVKGLRLSCLGNTLQRKSDSLLGSVRRSLFLCCITEGELFKFIFQGLVHIQFYLRLWYYFKYNNSGWSKIHVSELIWGFLWVLAQDIPLLMMLLI